MILLSAIVRACKIKNDHLKTRLPIHLALFEMLIFELDREFSTQPYLGNLYKAMFALAYYGMMRIGELAFGDHAIKAKDIHVGTNKNKILMLLYMSKTHGVESPPQRIKISENDNLSKTEKAKIGKRKRNFCPFQLVRSFIKICGAYHNDNDLFFVFSDNSQVPPSTVRALLKRLLSSLNLNADLYNFHSFRIGRTVDLFKYGVSIDRIKKLGRWKSNVVYKYLRDY